MVLNQHGEIVTQPAIMGTMGRVGARRAVPLGNRCQPPTERVVKSLMTTGACFGVDGLSIT